MSGSTTGSQRNTTRHLARGGVLSLLSTIVGTIGGLGLTLLITRGIPSTATAGALFTAIALFTIASKVAMLGSNTGLVKFLAASSDDDEVSPHARELVREAAVAVALVSGVLALSTWFGADTLGRLLASADPDVVGDGADVSTSLAGFLRRFSLVLVPTSLAGVYLGATRGWSDMLPTSLYDGVARPLAQLALVGAAIALSLGPQAVAAVYWVPYVGVLLAAWWWVRRRLPDGPAPGPPPRSAFWRFSLPRAFSRILSFMLARLDVIMLGALATSSDAGIYTTAIRFISVSMALQYAMNQPFEPEISRLLRYGSPEDTQRQFNIVTGWVVLASWPALFVLLLHGEVLLGVFGPDYARGATALAILAGVMLPGTAVGAIDLVLVMAGYSAWSLTNTGIALAANVGLNLLLIPRYGMSGAAIAWAVSLLCTNFIPVFQVRRWIGVSPWSRQLRRAATVTTVAFGVIGGGLRLIMGSSMTSLLIGTSVSGVVLLAVLIRNRQAFELDDFVAVLRRRG